MYNGVINVYKEIGYTSHDVVAKLRGILRQKKIGHTGTLDPGAEGVLPVCLGQATRLCDLLTDKTKVYEAVLLLGKTTDTQDITGTVVKEGAVPADQNRIAEVIRSFEGGYWQIPPMYSALKVNGKKLYELARQGKEVERKPREVKIFELSITFMDLPRVGLTIHCSKGTYIRTICHDIGEALGCGGCMESLKRTRVDAFFLEDSMTLDQIEQLRDEDRLSSVIIPIEKMFHGPLVYANDQGDRLVQNGNPVTEEDFAFWLDQDQGRRPVSDLPKDQWIRVYTAQGRFVGVYAYDAQRRRWRPEKMFTGEQ